LYFFFVESRPNDAAIAGCLLRRDEMVSGLGPLYRAMRHDDVFAAKMPHSTRDPAQLGRVN
jgi:hypothetical protein